jgi:hypothetical protein
VLWRCVLQKCSRLLGPCPGCVENWPSPTYHPRAPGLWVFPWLKSEKLTWASFLSDCTSSTEPFPGRSDVAICPSPRVHFAPAEMHFLFFGSLVLFMLAGLFFLLEPFFLLTSASKMCTLIISVQPRNLARSSTVLHGAQGGQVGPVEKRLCQYGKAGKVHATVLGTFGDASEGVNDLAADALAHGHLQCYNGTPGQVKAMYAQQARRRWSHPSHTAMRGWAKLVIDWCCPAGSGHSAWSAPLKAVDESTVPIRQSPATGVVMVKTVSCHCPTCIQHAQCRADEKIT